MSAKLTELIKKELPELTLPDDVIVKCTNYVALIAKWNKTYNLTALKNEEEMFWRHILDSLVAVPFIQGEKVLDFGSGAGLPGIPLALTLPDKTFTLLDSNNKKVKFLEHVILTLPIKNAVSYWGRVEEAKFDRCFDTVVTRATTSLLEFFNLTSALLCEKGRLLALKGPHPEAEIEALSKHFPELKVKVIKPEIKEFSDKRTLVTIDLG